MRRQNVVAAGADVLVHPYRAALRRLEARFVMLTRSRLSSAAGGTCGDCRDVFIEDDALLAVEDSNAKDANGWRLVGRLDGGAQSGAWQLRSGDGSTSVLKLALTPDWAEQMLRAARSVALVRAVGYPTPAWLRTGVLASGVGYQVQELVSGQSLDRIGVEQVHVFIEVLELQADLHPDPDGSWNRFRADEIGPGRAAR